MLRHKTLPINSTTLSYVRDQNKNRKNDVQGVHVAFAVDFIACHLGRIVVSLLVCIRTPYDEYQFFRTVRDQYPDFQLEIKKTW